MRGLGVYRVGGSRWNTTTPFPVCSEAAMRRHTFALLGVLISQTAPLTALLPGIVVSLAIFLIGLRYTTLWSYRAT